MADDNSDAPMSVKEVAELLGVSERQVWRYRESGKLTTRDGLLSVQQTQPGQVFRRSEVIKLKREREGATDENV